MTEHDLVRIVFSALNDVEEWRLGDPDLAQAKGYPRAFPAPAIDDHGILFIDVALDHASGEIVCHEVNGPNAAGSDALTGESALRAQAEVAQTLRFLMADGYCTADGALATQVVSVHAHQHWKFFRTGSEFYPRVDRYAALLGDALPRTSVRRRGAAERLGDERFAVVMGDVPAVAAALEVDAQSRRLICQGRPVVFIGNPNLVPELWRSAKLPPGDWSSVDLRMLHAGRLAAIIHDKPAQQRLFRGTGVRPLRHFTAHTREAIFDGARRMLALGPVVLKPTGTSGGTGVHVVVPGMSAADIEGCVARVLGDCQAKYGDNIEAMVLPLTGVEFVRSTAYPMADGGHLWDLRIAVLCDPGWARVFPVSMRVAPQPFDPATFHCDRGQWISNASGRLGTQVLSGMDDRALAAVGMGPDLLDRCFEACVQWTQKAWNAAVDGAFASDDTGRDP